MGEDLVVCAGALLKDPPGGRKCTAVSRKCTSPCVAPNPPQACNLVCCNIVCCKRVCCKLMCCKLVYCKLVFFVSVPTCVITPVCHTVAPHLHLACNNFRLSSLRSTPECFSFALTNAGVPFGCGVYQRCSQCGQRVFYYLLPGSNCHRRRACCCEQHGGCPCSKVHESILVAGALFGLPEHLSHPTSWPRYCGMASR